MLKNKKRVVTLLMFVLILLCSTTQPASAAVSYKLLPITGYQQEDTNLCWAACEQAVLGYLGFSPLPSQYSIVTTVFNPYQNAPANANQVTNSLTGFGCNASASAYSVTFSTIQSYIDNYDSPMITNRSGHATLIRGYYHNSYPPRQDVYFIDPSPSADRYQYMAYTMYYPNWYWTVKDIWI
jgi:hypothetical protein